MKERIIIETVREGYGTDQIRSTMTVGELINFLSDYNEDAPVYLSFDNGMLVKKEYVKGRENIYMNPAINAYNATCAGADRTAQLIFRCILQPLSDGDEKDAFDMF